MTESDVRVLVIDDDQKIRQLLRLSLGVQGYTVFEASTGQAGIEAMILDQPDLLLLDLGLPDINGLEVIQQLRGWTNVPIIVLSVLYKESDKVAVLDAGADDYVTKPFSIGELTARMRVALRRIPEVAETPIFETGDLQVDLVRRRVKVSGAEVRLTPREYDLLKILVTYAGKVVTQRQLLRDVWGDEFPNEVHVLRVHMSNLRAKIEPEPARPMYIITEPGVGYRLIVT
jgi:two-component system KDP operon response regulator KdpE